jgi:hypothetical protein
LAEIADLGDRHVGIAGQVQQTIKQHRAMTGRQHEPVAVGPVGGGGVEFQVLLEQHGGHIGHAHRHARVARVGGLHRIHRQHPKGGGFHPVIGVRLAQRGDVQGGLQSNPGAGRAYSARS